MDLDRSAILALNAAHETETSRLDLGSLGRLIEQAFRIDTCPAGGRDAVLIALDQTADYASVNYRYFRERYPRFVYIDRVIVAPRARGRGLARRLYGSLFAAAAAAGHDVVCCEVNSHPPNPASEAFHAALGFTEVGRATIADGAKTVRYLVRRIE